MQGGDAAVTAWLEGALGARVAGADFAGGSSWSSAYVYRLDDGRRVFVKTARGRGGAAMFEGEAAGLAAMRAAGALRVPDVLHTGALSGGAGGAFIVMEHLELAGRPDQAALGAALARMHAAPAADPDAAAGRYGFALDNTIGGTPQPNGWADDWVEFFRERRLRHQLALAGDARLAAAAAPLLDGLGAFFEGLSAEDLRPAVLHGDLWSGNVGSAARADGAAGAEPVVFDPATYYGHSEAEFGMAWCAGFSPAFWGAYHAVLPRRPGFEERKALYELYHILNHFNLFGGGYHGQAEAIIARLVKKL